MFFPLGSIVVQSVKDITRVFVNPDFEEASRSRMRYTVLCLFYFIHDCFLLVICVGLINW